MSITVNSELDRLMEMQFSDAPKTNEPEPDRSNNNESEKR